MRRLVPLLVPLAALAPAGALADGTWDLRCPSMPREQRPPAAVWPAVHAFWPWGPRAFEPGLHAGPVWLLAGSYRTSISRDGDETDSQGYYLHRALVAVAPSSTGAVVLRGHRLGEPGPRRLLGFSLDGANRCRLEPPDGVACGDRILRTAPALRIAPGRGWRVVETELRIGRTGCFAIDVRGVGLRGSIPLAVPGPDWGTPGW